MKTNIFKTWKATTKYMVVTGNKNYVKRVFDTKREADEYGQNYLDCGYITNFYAFPVKKVWINAN